MNVTQKQIDALNASCDITGASIAVGTRVRSFDFPMLMAEKIAGIDPLGMNSCYCEGVVVAIGTMMEGCPRYHIKVDERIFGGHIADGPTDIFPPVNGTPTMMESVCLGVFALPSDEWENAGPFLFRTLPETKISDIFCEEKQMIKITREYGQFWLQDDRETRPVPCRSMKEAKAQGDRIISEMQNKQDELMLKDAGLNSDWSVIYNDQISFEHKEKQALIYPTGYNGAGVLHWELSENGNTVETDLKSPSEAIKLL